MPITFIQANCYEGDQIDPHQAEVIKRDRPDMVFFEMPSFDGDPSSSFNAYGPGDKPLAMVEDIKAGLRKAAETVPYALSDILVWENIEELWRTGHNVQIYNVDAPQELRLEYYSQYHDLKFDQLKGLWQFWVYMYVRDLIMANNIERVVGTYPESEALTAAVFLQSIHWRDAQFLMKHPSNEETWNYYFHQFPDLTPARIADGIRQASPLLYDSFRNTALGKLP